MAIAALLAGCGTLDRLSEVGRDAGHDADRGPDQGSDMAAAFDADAGTASPRRTRRTRSGALGSRAFFKDQRAAQVGDIVTVLVRMNDTANLKNVTSTARTSAESGGMPNFFGLETILPPAIRSLQTGVLEQREQQHRHRTDPAQRGGDVTACGRGHSGAAERQSGCGGPQEFLVNSELRELRVTGVIRPQDIASDNTVLHDRMAEARIAYGGKGQLTDLQRARWGQQMLDILAPF